MWAAAEDIDRPRRVPRGRQGREGRLICCLVDDREGEFGLRLLWPRASGCPRFRLPVVWLIHPRLVGSFVGLLLFEGLLAVSSGCNIGQYDLNSNRQTAPFSFTKM